MIEVLRDVEERMLTLLVEGQWQSLDIDYHAPRVWRMWLQHGEYRVFLHRIFYCRSGEALLHPHPWPSAVRVIRGDYEMLVGHGAGLEPPPIAMRLQFSGEPRAKEPIYEMVERDGWHAVRPRSRWVDTLMVSGAPYEPRREMPIEPRAPLAELSRDQQQEMLVTFGSYYC